MGKRTTRKHTPGPWTTSGIGSSIFVVSSTGYVIAKVSALSAYAPAHMANATLMAQAPALLAALVDLRARVRDHVNLNDVKKHYHLIVAHANAGIAVTKARGD